MALFSGEGWLFLLRWFHFLAGITWIGMLYYFNFVQTPFFATADSPVRTGMIAGSLVGRALWWFRWGAMLTFITGWLYILHRIGQLGLLGFFQTSYGWAIFIGGIIGSLMWFNVWFVIWPAQKVVIASATQVAKGGQANPAAAPRGQRSGFTSRTNTLLSIPMLFFMGAASHFAFFTPGERGERSRCSSSSRSSWPSSRQTRSSGRRDPERRCWEPSRERCGAGSSSPRSW